MQKFLEFFYHLICFFSNFHLLNSGKWSNWKSIFVKWVSSTTNQYHGGGFPKGVTLLETNISGTKALLKMIFLFPRWDMLAPWRVSNLWSFGVSLFWTIIYCSLPPDHLWIINLWLTFLFKIDDFGFYNQETIMDTKTKRHVWMEILNLPN